ncbi:LPS export ABC transporter periplasmic protein LptC [Gammaproteobacteria bacterium 45_16_T64]|nr:LPS export ABC transporter periplasmic protein LptC [Gammaproteobacteria bacterium 45_16_T64]
MLLLTALLLRWFTDYRPSSDSPSMSASLLPDAIVTGLQQQNYDSSGLPSYSLSADQATHFSEKGITQLKSPNLLLFEDGTPTWHAVALNGLTANNGDIIELRGSVTIQQDADAYAVPVVLKTNSLRLSPKKEYAETHEPVTIHQGTGITRATGMQVNIRDGEIILLSKVKSRYETTP